MHNIIFLATFNLFLHRKNKKLRQNIDNCHKNAAKQLIEKIFSDGEKSEQVTEAHTTI